MKLLVLGATGLVGSHVLDLAIADGRIHEVIAPVRRPLPERPGLLAPRVDFDSLPEDAAWWRVDAVICALGTTMCLGAGVAAGMTSKGELIRRSIGVVARLPGDPSSTVVLLTTSAGVV